MNLSKVVRKVQSLERFLLVELLHKSRVILLVVRGRKRIRRETRSISYLLKTL